MVLTPELAVLIAFCIFSLIFAAKVYPSVVAALDEYIESVKNKLSKAEEMRLSASRDLQNAVKKEKETGELINISRFKSEEKMRKLQEENELQLEMIRERHQVSLQNQLEAEFRKQRNALIDRLSDLIVEGVEKKIETQKDSKLGEEIRKSDLEKLLN